MTTLFDFLNSINHTKEDLFANDSECVKDYVPFLVNRGLSMSYDTIMYANEMNLRPNIDKQRHYDFLRVAIPKRKRYNKWAKKDTLSNDVLLVSQYYKYNKEQAVKALSLLNEEQLDIIRHKMDIGGMIKNE